MVESLTAKRMRALSDPNRMRLVEALRTGEHNVKELVEELGLRQSLVSFHLRTLRTAGLVSVQRDGREANYRLQRDVFVELSGAVDALATPLDGAGASRNGASPNGASRDG